MKFFVDTAEIDDIKDLAATGMVDGVTTNPSLIMKSGRDIIEVTKEICDIVDGPVSAEVAATEADAMIAEALEECPLDVRIVRKQRLREIAASHLALCASGTATLEVGLARTPMVVVYRIKRWSYWLGKMVIRVPHISLVNLVLGERVVPELIQSEANAEDIAEAADDPDAAETDPEATGPEEVKPA